MAVGARACSAMARSAPRKAASRGAQLAREAMAINKSLTFLEQVVNQSLTGSQHAKRGTKTSENLSLRYLAVYAARIGVLFFITELVLHGWPVFAL
mgnify:CR=1 FL=1